MEAENLCPFCKKDLAGHESFLFNNSPDAIRMHEETEWQPSPDEVPIPYDKGPARVAYVWSGDRHPDHIGDPVVAVHGGTEEGLYGVCAGVRVGPIWLGLCLPIARKNPCGDESIGEIS